jgi:hypothetical protein
MQSRDYRRFVRTIIKNSIRKKFPGLKQALVEEVAAEASVAIHARFYGAAVDGVASPIWRDDPNYAMAFTDAKPTKTAQDLLDA